mmetsp:Transcript_28712/g.66635  ORF Transcript_28712/g.66635 Transcript_28712/m.66635 type:complete len:467 (+) Transcript_28712:84-1484(+)|eukprot:CAMPEP_0178392212 /NCGR_PEP_ID=MMETSP0689_2-20121128/11564_1 /TAXON_ID=160604 /ORGANISM="Amphidinium massartii, Strain CS-259" /LENGTH=466 /DNA_ID=CAMNT_0020012783 /DNA_START=11 /DNA_END=1411 /DNA_ORIENTATION=-
MALIVGGWHGDSEDSSLGREVRAQVQADMATQMQLKPLEAKVDMLDLRLPMLEGKIAQLTGVVDGLRAAFEAEVRRSEDRLQWWKQSLSDEVDIKTQDMRLGILREVDAHMQDLHSTLTASVATSVWAQHQLAYEKGSVGLAKLETDVTNLTEEMEELRLLCTVANEKAMGAAASAATAAQRDVSVKVSPDITESIRSRDAFLRDVVALQAEKVAYATATEICEELAQQWQRTWRTEEDRAIAVEDGVCQRLEALEEQSRQGHAIHSPAEAHGSGASAPRLATGLGVTGAAAATATGASNRPGDAAAVCASTPPAAPATAAATTTGRSPAAARQRSPSPGRGTGFETIVRGELKALLRRLTDHEVTVQDLRERIRRGEAHHSEWEHNIREEVVRARSAEQELRMRIEVLQLHAVSGSEPSKHVEDQLRQALHGMHELRGQMNTLVRGQDTKPTESLDRMRRRMTTM